MVSHVKVLTDEGERIIGKPKGNYITLEFADFVHYDGDAKDDVSKTLAKELSKIIKLDDSMTALVVGLGNWNITPDALGPKVVSKLMVTRHLKEYVPNSIDEGVRPVCAVAPGVLGITGIETSEIVKGIVDKIKPNIVICIDALASRKTQRVNRTIQIGDTGISPATLANDTIDLVIDDLTDEATSGGEFYKLLQSLDRNEKQNLIRETLGVKMATLVVTPKDIDMIIDSVSKIIANGINIALQPALTLDDINKYVN